MAVPSPSGEAATQAADERRWAGQSELPAPALPVTVAGAATSPIILAALSAAADAEPKAGPSAALARAAKALDIAAPRVEIVFEPDSSYLANGAAAQLESLLASLPRDAAWEVELQAAVDDAAGSLPPDKALAYNQWLAERRQSRVEDWLGTRPGAPVLRVRRSVLPHDPSRRVVISARPLP